LGSSRRRAERYSRSNLEPSGIEMFADQSGDKGALLEPLYLAVGVEAAELFRLQQYRDLARFLSRHAVLLNEKAVSRSRGLL
jgi:hypothetical protein